MSPESTSSAVPAETPVGTFEAAAINPPRHSFGSVLVVRGRRRGSALRDRLGQRAFRGSLRARDSAKTPAAVSSSASSAAVVTRLLRERGPTEVERRYRDGAFRRRVGELRSSFRRGEIEMLSLVPKELENRRWSSSSVSCIAGVRRTEGSKEGIRRSNASLDVSLTGSFSSAIPPSRWLLQSGKPSTDSIAWSAFVRMIISCGSMTVGESIGGVIFLSSG
jgi:hypothetical protein